MEKLDLYIFHGNLATGKTTSASKIGKAINIPVLDPDLMRRELGITDYSPNDTPIVMQEVVRRLINSLLTNETAILSTSYVRKIARNQSYRHIKMIGEELNRQLKAVIVTCKCSEELSKQRISTRPPKDHLHCPPTNPIAYNRVKSQNEPISDDEIMNNPNFSFLVYNTEFNRILRTKVRQSHEKAIENLESILLG